MRHKYKIVINAYCKKAEVSYDFGQIKNIVLGVEEQKASIEYEVGTLRTATDILSFKYKDFRDAYRKVFLLHAIRFNTGLEVNRITVIIDGESSSFDKDHDPTGFFPYMFSMIGKTDLGLENSWKALEKDIINSTQTQMKNDLRFSAMYSFLASRNREYLVDRFANLWTAMNAYYSYVAKMYEDRLIRDYKLDSLSGKLKLCGKDADSIGLASWLIYPQYPKESERGQLKEEWKNNYDVENCIESYTISNIKKLYNAAKNELKGKTIPKEYAELTNRAEVFKVKLFSYFTFVYPYNLRCKYFHGNVPTILLAAYNDYEIRALELVNYFLTQFLNEAIPEMYKKNFWNDKKQAKAIEYTEFLREKRISDIINNMSKNENQKKQ